MNRLSRTSIVAAPFSSVIEYVSDFFEERPALRVKAVGFATVVVEARHEVTGDHTDQTRRHEAVMLHWRPASPLFPAFDGSITVRPNSTGATLRIEGSYLPPAGPLGRVFDKIVGERLALGTMAHLLRSLRAYVERRYGEFERTSPTIEELNDSARLAGR